MPIGIVAADDPRARIAHHQAELEKAWRDYYGAENVRASADARTADATYTSYGREWDYMSSFCLWASRDQKASWAQESHLHLSAQPCG